MYKEVDCGSCRAACCRRGVAMELTEDDYDLLTSHGAELQHLPSLPQKRPTLMGVSLPVFITRQKPDELFVLQEDCPNLQAPTEEGEQSLCGVHKTDAYPELCREFEVGGYACRVMRVKAGIDPPEDFMAYCQFTQS